MAQNALKPRDSASEFVDIYKNTANRFGIQNARSNAHQADNLNSRPDEDGRNARPKVSYKGPAEVYDFNEEKTKRKKKVNVAERYYNEADLQKNVPANTNESPYKVKITTLDRLTGRVFAYICWSISLYISIIQGFFLILCLIMLGWASMTEDVWIAWAANEALKIGASVLGFDYTNTMYIAVFSAFFSITCGLVSLFGFLLFAYLLKLDPLHGNGGGTKTSLFIFGFVVSILPLNTALWIWAVKRYPK